MDAVRTPEHPSSGLASFPWRPGWLDDLPGFTGLRAAVRPLVILGAA